jgi:hypothetical protein
VGEFFFAGEERFAGSEPLFAGNGGVGHEEIVWGREGWMGG